MHRILIMPDNRPARYPANIKPDIRLVISGIRCIPKCFQYIRKAQINGLVNIFCHGMFLHIYRICPGPRSGFVYLHTDPDPTFIIQIRIRITD